MEVFMIEMTDENKDQIQDVINIVQDETAKYIQDLAGELQISEACAFDVWYLRTRSRWTQSLENELIQLHKDGNPPNICDFG